MIEKKDSELYVYTDSFNNSNEFNNDILSFDVEITTELNDNSTESSIFNNLFDYSFEIKNLIINNKIYNWNDLSSFYKQEIKDQLLNIFKDELIRYAFNAYY